MQVSSNVFKHDLSILIRLQRELGDGATIVPVIISSDKTQLTLF